MGSGFGGGEFGRNDRQWFPAAVVPMMIILSCTPRPYSIGSGSVWWRGPGKRLRTAERARRCSEQCAGMNTGAFTIKTEIWGMYVIIVGALRQIIGKYQFKAPALRTEWTFERYTVLESFIIYGELWVLPKL